MQVVTAREQKSNETKEKILDSVEYIIQNYGIKQLTVRNVCEQASVSTGSFYNFYQSKENVLFEFTKSRFAQVLKKNPIPAMIAEEDFIKRTIWPFLVYSMFCVNMGKQYIRFLYQNCENDVFVETCFPSLVIPSLTRAYDEGYLSRGNRPEMLNRVIEDLRLIIRGAVWCWSEERSGDSRPLHVIVEQVVSRIMLASASERYMEMIPFENYSLLSDTPDLLENIVNISF